MQLEGAVNVRDLGGHRTADGRRLAVGRVRLRWVGRTIRAECEISVDPACSVVQAHDIAVSAEHALIHAIPRLAAASVHADPLDGADHHAMLAHHAGAA